MANGGSEIILYQAEDGDTNIEVKLHNDSVWLSQAEMAELFQTTKSTISYHVNAIFRADELSDDSVVRIFRTTAADGKTYNVEHYNLDMIISVGYRVNSHRGVQFRRWATKTLAEYLVKGFVMNDARLAGEQSNYFDELVERVRRIRTSERNFYEKVLDIFATSIDYDPKTEYAKLFYATVQNKFHYAITGNTAAELIVKRIDSGKLNMGLTSWKGSIITRDDAEVAKNYLEELELRRLMLLVEQFLSFAELQSVEQRPMYMKSWVKKLDEFLILNEKQILQNAGKVSHKQMEEKVKEELAKFNAKNRKRLASPQ